MPPFFPMQQPQAVTAVGAPSPAETQAQAVVGTRARLTPQQVEHILSLQQLNGEGETLGSKEAQIAALRRPSQRDGGFGDIGSSLGDMIRGVSANFKEKDLEEQRASLASKSAAARNDFYKAMQDGEAPDVSSLFFADEKDAPVKAKALAAALRQQQQMGMLAQLTGDPTLAGVGKDILARVAKGEDAIPATANMRLQRQMEAEKARTEQEWRHAQEGHMTAQEALQRAQLAQDAFSLTAPTATSPGYKLNRKTGDVEQLLDAAPGKPAGPGDGRKQAKDLDDALEKLKNDVDPSRGRNGAFGLDLALGTSAQKVKALVKNPETGEVNYNLTVGQVPEFIQNVAGMLSNGGHAAQGTIEHLYPHTAGMSVAKKLEWITGHPEVANVPDFVKQFYETAEREDHLAQERMRNVKLDRLSAHQGHFKLYPEEFKATARQYLKDMSDEDLGNAFVGKYDRSGKPKAAPTGLSADEAAEFEALHKKYGGAK